MGEQRVSILKDADNMQRFVRQLLDDVQALDYMLQNDWFESDIIRIGAEQEMCLVYKDTMKPAPIAMEVLEKMKEHPWVETELARFNLEIGLEPRTFTGDCISAMHHENQSRLDVIDQYLAEYGVELILTGVLPTLRKFHLEMDYLTPKKRYFALMEAINNQLIGSAYELRLSGIDELLVKHDSPMLEACNTSFQVHLQVAPADFVKMYNIAQALAAPVMGISANSAVVFGRRLWHESRIALFQQALDTRATHEHMRERSPRVNFGSNWLDKSILDIYREDIARFRVLLAGDVEEDSLNMIESGNVPKLRALQVHNSTVYRWNRPCYGISPNGKPHLRIENRVLASGPTVIDEMANATFWLGAMIGYSQITNDIREHISFSDVKDNFIKAARYGADAGLTWLNDHKIGIGELVIKEILPVARQGLQSRQVNQEDIDKYLGIIEERAQAHMTGARWSLRAYTAMKEQATPDEALCAITASTLKNQKQGIPVHKWELPKLEDLEKYRPTTLKVEEFMTTDLFTVQKEDIVELVAEMMDWRKIRYTPVEDSKGKLAGLMTSRIMLRHFIKKKKEGDTNQTTVADVMIQNPVTIAPSANIMEAMHIMRGKKIGCLPVTYNDELVGIITEMDFLRITSRLLERLQNE